MYLDISTILVGYNGSQISSPWTVHGASNLNFGSAVSISDDGQKMVFNSSCQNSYCEYNSSGGWTETGTRTGLSGIDGVALGSGSTFGDRAE